MKKIKREQFRTRAHAAPLAGFRNCCMLTGEFDGTDRAYFYRE